jgi:hypothetical protein
MALKAVRDETRARLLPERAEAVIIKAGRLKERTDSMRLRTSLRVLTTACIVLLVTLQGMGAGSLAMAAADEHFSVREYNIFHDVLHPLQHEALPKKDFKTIRAKAGELVAKGRAIVQLGIPRGVEAIGEFAEGLKAFDKALTKFKTDARKKSDARLEQSYSAVHDAFETLASLLPRK